MDEPKQIEQQTLESYTASKQEMWNTVIASLNEGMKDFAKLPELQNVIYTKKQDAVDYYYALLAKLSEMSKRYKTAYAERYNFYKVGSQIRYTTEASINAQIDSDLADFKYQIDIISNHSKYMMDTIKTISDMIYAIANRIRIEELIRGVSK